MKTENIYILIETERLIIRPFKIEDCESAFEWLGDSDVMKYIPNGADSSVHITKKRIENYINIYENIGFSKYVIIEKENNNLIGDCGVLPIENTELIELGFRIKKEKWRNGFATEASNAVIHYCFSKLNFNTIYALVEPENKISKKIVQNKLNFAYEKNMRCYDTHFELFVLTKQM